MNEVVLGVQFAPPRGYQQIRAGEVWNLFKNEFPLVEEKPPIPPMFETFGFSQPGAMLNFGIVSGATHDRYWFLSPQRSELIQFQQDRLLHNWRKFGDEGSQYPRFEKMIADFEAELRALDGYFNDLETQRLECNQAEVSYINHIPAETVGDRGKASNWLRFLNFDVAEPDDLSVVFRRALKDASGVPTARLICELVTNFTPLGARILVLTLTVRGAPTDTSTDAAFDLLKRGHEVIVTEFAAITTDSAQEVWERVR